MGILLLDNIGGKQRGDMKKTLLKLLSVVLLLTAGALCQVATSGTLSAASTDCSVGQSCLVLHNLTTGSASSGGVTVGLTLTGSSGTAQFEASNGDGNWKALPSTDATPVTSATATGVWQFNVAGYTTVRVRISALSSATFAVRIQSSQASARSGGGGGSSGVSSLAATTPVTVDAATGAVTVACPTCTKSAAALTNTALVTGAGLQAEQTPSATSTLSAGGAMSLAGSLTTPSLTLNGTTAAAMATTTTASAIVQANASGLIDPTFTTPITYLTLYNGGPSSVTFAGSADVIRGTQFVVTQAITFSNINISINTTDAANPVYGAAIVDVGTSNGGFGTSGAARCHNTSGVQLGVSNAVTAFPCSEGAVTLLPGNYALLTTAHIATGKYNGSLAFMTYWSSGGVAGCTASNGVITFTTPCTISFSATGAGVFPVAVLH